MTDVNPKTCTAVTFLFEGEKHKLAAEAFVVQFSDGGMDQDIEARLSTQGHNIVDTDFSLEKNTIKITLGR